MKAGWHKAPYQNTSIRKDMLLYFSQKEEVILPMKKYSIPIVSPIEYMIDMTSFKFHKSLF
jgi:hypothetical protein